MVVTSYLSETVTPAKAGVPLTPSECPLWMKGEGARSSAFIVDPVLVNGTSACAEVTVHEGAGVTVLE